MIFFTGDIHGDKSRFSDIKKAKAKKGDTVIVCGDFGFIWDNSKAEQKMLKNIGKKKYNTLFVDGGNDNHELINEYPLIDFCGARARKISGNLYALNRGDIYEIEGKKIFAMGGGDTEERYDSGTDSKLRLPTLEEIDYARKNIMDAGKQIDIVVTHEAPAKLRSLLIMDDKGRNHLHTFLEWINTDVTYKAWYMGKYHINRDIPQKYHLLFTAVKKYEEPQK